MTIIAKSIMLVVVASLLSASLSCAQQVDLKVGDKAPDFRLMGSDGKEYALAQFAGKSRVALCWTRRAGSSGWKQACDSLTAQSDRLSQSTVKVLMIACSTLNVTQDEMTSGKYSFPMLADETQATAKAYGTLMPGGGNLCERWMFLIDDKGIIQGINKNVTPQTQGTQLVKMLTNPGAVSQTTTRQLVPGSYFTVQFPEMPPTLFALSTKRTDPPQMTVYLPHDYDPQRKHPLFIFLNGSDGGNASNPGIARTLSEELDFVCVALPLFKVSLDPDAPDNAPPLIVVRGGDGPHSWSLYKTMLTKLDELVPNIDPMHRILGGCSNGAHATAAVLDGSDGEVARVFSAFMFVEGGGKLKHYELLKGKPFLMVSSNSKSLPRAQEITDAAKAAGAQTTLVFEDIGQHGFPPASYPAVREWLRGPALASADGDDDQTEGR